MKILTKLYAPTNTNELLQKKGEHCKVNEFAFQKSNCAC